MRAILDLGPRGNNELAAIAAAGCKSRDEEDAEISERNSWDFVSCELPAGVVRSYLQE